MTPSRPLRLNWGCGATGEPGWINSDVKRGPGIHLPCDIRDGLPVRTGSFDYVVSIHALQEIALPDLPQVLRELRRVLKPGGVLRLGLPDLDRGVDAYRRGDRDYFEVPDEDAEDPAAKLVYQLLWYGYSRTLFTWGFARESLEKAGFRAVRRCRHRETGSSHPAIVELDDREAETLFVEAER